MMLSLQKYRGQLSFLENSVSSGKPSYSSPAVTSFVWWQASAGQFYSLDGDHCSSGLRSVFIHSVLLVQVRLCLCSPTVVAHLELIPKVKFVICLHLKKDPTTGAPRKAPVPAPWYCLCTLETYQNIVNPCWQGSYYYQRACAVCQLQA